MVKYSNKSEEGRVYLGSEFGVAVHGCRVTVQKEGAAHCLSSQEAESDELYLTLFLPFMQSRITAQRMVPPPTHTWVSLLTPINSVKITPGGVCRGPSSR